MELVVKKFSSHQESEAVERAYFRSLTPQQRLEILLDLVGQGETHEAPQRFERVYRIVKLHGDRG